MNNYYKPIVVVSAMAMCVFGMAIKLAPHPSTRVIDTSVPKVASIAFYQEVMTFDHGKTTIPLGPKLPYVAPNHKSFARPLVQYDAYEGGRDPGTGSDPALPTDGQYDQASFPCALGGNATSGYRWYYGNTFDYPNFIHHMNKIRTAGAGAVFLDTLIRVNGTSTGVAHWLVFTYNDEFDERSGETTGTFTGTLPAAGNTGVDFTFGTPLTDTSAGATGTTWRVNADTSALNAGAGLAMPTNNNGWFQEIFANSVGPTVYASTVQPMQFGTQGTNPSQSGRWAFSDGNGTAGSQTGSFGFYFDWGSGYYALPALTSVDGTQKSQQIRGQGQVNQVTPLDLTAANIANMMGVSGSSYQITQSLQTLGSRNNAEVNVVVQIPAAAYANALLNQLKVMMVGKANGTASPAGTVGTLNISMMRQDGSGQFDIVRQGGMAQVPTTSASADGGWIQGVSPSYGFTSPNAPYSSLLTPPSYVYTDGAGNRSVMVKVAGKQISPTLLGWKLTINQLFVDADEYGPSNESPTIAFTGSV